MRSSTPLVFLALSALAAPTLAAPTFEPVYAREDATSALLSRQAPPSDESGAFLPFLLSAIPAAISLFKGKRELETLDLAAREAHTVAEFRAGLEEYLRTHGGHLRRAEDEQSGAFLPLLLSAIPAAISLFKGKREFEDLMAREPMIYQPQSCIWSGTCRTQPGINNGWRNHLMIARENPNEQSGAFLPLLLTAIPAAISLFKGGKREFDDVFARELEQELLARAGDTESGAFLPLLFSAIPAVISLFKGKREFEDVFMRSLTDLD